MKKYCGKSTSNHHVLGPLDDPALLVPSKQSCFHQCTRFPQDWSGDLLTIPLGVLSSGPRFLPHPVAPLAPAPWWLSVTGGLPGVGRFSPLEQS